MPSVSLAGYFNFQGLTSLGALAASYRLYTYEPSTTTLKTAYTDSAGSVAHSYTADGSGGFYIALDARGELPAPLFLQAGGYDLTLKTSAGVTVWTRRAYGLNESGTDPTVRLADFGGLANDSSGAAKTANDAAFVAALASLAEQSTGPLDAASYSNAGTIVVGVGSWWFGTKWQLIRNVRIVGESGPDGNSFGSTRLIFPDGDHGIVIHNPTTSGTTGADGTILENLSIIPASYATTGTPPAAGSSHGVWMRARARIINSLVAGWSGNGISIIATSGGGGALEGNANSWHLSSLRLVQNAGDGLYVSGSDANAGVAERVDSSSNGGWGVNDQSFLGNTYLGGHTSANTLGPYKTTNHNARSVFLGCYSESGQGTGSVILYPSMAIGGLHGSGFDTTTTGTVIGDQGFLAITASPGVTTPQYSFVTDATTGLYQIGSGTGRFGLTSLGVQKGQFGPGGFKALAGGASAVAATTDSAEIVQGGASANIVLGYASSASYTGPGIKSQANTASGTGFNLFTGANSGGVCFQILGNGNAQNTSNSYGAISDVKTKEDVTDANPASAWAAVKAYRWVNYTSKIDVAAGRLLGLVAQEAEQVSPGVVYETPDYENVEDFVDGEPVVVQKPLGTTTKAVKYSVVSMQGLFALQQALARIETLEQAVQKLGAGVKV